MNIRRKILLASVAAAAMVLATTSAFAFGAIAVSNPGGLKASEIGYGVGHGSSKGDAQAHALKKCFRVGNADCSVAVWYETCGAYAADRTYYGYGYGSTQAIAEEEALGHCKGDHCKIVISDCDDE